MQTQRKDLGTRQRKQGGKLADQDCHIETILYTYMHYMHTYTYMTHMGEIDSQWEAVVQHSALSFVLCDDLDGWGGVWEGGSRGKGERYIYVCIYMLLAGSCSFTQKLTQHCKAFILQFSKINKILSKDFRSFSLGIPGTLGTNNIVYLINKLKLSNYFASVCVFKQQRYHSEQGNVCGLIRLIVYGKVEVGCKWAAGGVRL